ncbi:MAG: SPOR domain-containing protein [Rectinemataceae bacterium]
MKSIRMLLLMAGLFFVYGVRSAFPQGDTTRAPPSSMANSTLVPDPFAGSSIIAYQVGAFLDKKNADDLATKLGMRDIVGNVHMKIVHGKAFWVVIVTVSGIPFENLQQELLDAGYASFPIRKTDQPLADILIKERGEIQ